jgi:hypothetical protein
MRIDFSEFELIFFFSTPVQYTIADNLEISLCNYGVFVRGGDREIVGVCNNTERKGER